MTIDEKAKQYAADNNYNPYVSGEAARYYTIVLEKGYRAGYNECLDHFKWRNTSEELPKEGEMVLCEMKSSGSIVSGNIYLDDGIPTVDIDSSVDFDDYGGYEVGRWKYIN